MKIGWVLRLILIKKNFFFGFPQILYFLENTCPKTIIMIRFIQIHVLVSKYNHTNVVGCIVQKLLIFLSGYEKTIFFLKIALVLRLILIKKNFFLIFPNVIFFVYYMFRNYSNDTISPKNLF